MNVYQVTVDLPILVEVEAEDEDAAEAAGDIVVATAWKLLAEAVEDAGWPKHTYLGSRYDNTEVSDISDLYPDGLAAGSR